ncbi:hypothetical protein B0H10DRAFT_1949302 [Mycena sp. CBHHK59/15]|nr:hypothetical protein B0H10DRAFT_1949302 [Mycena sp. CBHHK59/15]
MFWLSLAWRPWLWLGFARLWLQKSEAKAKALRSGLAWPGFGYSPGFRYKSLQFCIPSSLIFPTTYCAKGESQGQKPWLWLHRSQAKAKALVKPWIWLGLALQSQGFGFRAFWLEAKPSTSVTVKT